MYQTQPGEIGKLQGRARKGKDFGDVPEGVGSLIRETVSFEGGRIGALPIPKESMTRRQILFIRLRLARE